MLPEEVHPSNMKDFEEFVALKSGKGLSGNFGERVLQQDLQPCLKFRSKTSSFLAKDYSKIMESGLQDNNCFIEPISNSSKGNCMLCGYEQNLKFRYSIQSPEKTDKAVKWKMICQFCRDKIVSVADFYCFVRNIRAGIMKANIVDMYRECIKLRLRMNIARIMCP